LRASLLFLAVVVAGCVQPSASLDPAALLGAGGLVCGEPCDVAVERRAGSASEPALAADPGDPLHLVAGSIQWEPLGPDTDRSWLYAHVSLDGGATWETSRLPGGLDVPPDHPLFGATQMADPWVGILPDGTVLYTGLAFHGARARPAGTLLFPLVDLTAFVARSTDGGLTYPDVTVLDAGMGGFSWVVAGPVGAPVFTPGMYADSTRLATGPDGSAVVFWDWARVPPPEDPGGVFDLYLRASVSTDGGVTWSEAVQLPTLWGVNAAPAIAPDGTIYAAFAGGPSEESGTYLSVSRDRGATWESFEAAIGNAEDYAYLALVPREGGVRAVVTYVEPRGDGDGVPVLQWSDDEGRTWSQPLALDEPAAAGRMLPNLAADGNGRVVVGYYYPVGDGEEFRAVAWDGERIAGPVALNRQAMAPGGIKLHYVGLAGLPEGAFAVWIGGDAPETDVHGSRVGPTT